MDESKTFDKLRRIPLEDMNKIVDINNFRAKVAPSVVWGDFSFDSSSYFKRELELHKWRLSLLADNGWTFEDFMVENEKNAIKLMISDYNAKNSIPNDLLDRIRMVFPNAKFSSAKLEIE
ncbi:MAG TPA: hypothetical protein VIY47_02640 [Ignavibacteriaceae bacterium]